MASAATTLRGIEQPGLYWKPGLFGARPTWTKEPSLDKITELAHNHLKLPQDELVDLRPFAEGAFNKLYEVICSKGQFIFRVTLPVAPEVKTRSEVATLSLLHERTNIPVPEIIADNDDLEDDLGFEWILMERMPGRPLREVWHKMSWLHKELLVKQIVGFMVQLYYLKLPSIGSLYSEESIFDWDRSRNYTVGDAVTQAFFIDDHIQQSIYRGPFASSQSFVNAHMAFLQHDITKLQHAEGSDGYDSDDEEQAEGMSEIYAKLQKVIPTIFPAANPGDEDEETILFNGDISFNNIIVSPSGDLVGIVDWECTTTVPPWHACQIPQFLDGLLPTSTTSQSQPPLPLTPEALADKDAVQFHHEQLQAYELTCLRTFFVEEMRRQCPEWLVYWQEGAKKRDVLIAIEECGDDSQWTLINGWLDAVLEGREPKKGLLEAMWTPVGE
ncbi:hypothetical protein J4E93_007769 [Alternaria ventricosa]|uniref:uncharacterized protein n=1 Tax=Alternaria ventricosa TaxID=1187951 RepID=UPI0020C5961F|nr:uncharacterized protein J4E93_007769 [Alternaria ventricosa]KAI4641671.1 hypothetical protein J4E93_007769 [Alternaria ventricosa]